MTSCHIGTISDFAALSGTALAETSLFVVDDPLVLATSRGQDPSHSRQDGGRSPAPTGAQKGTASAHPSGAAGPTAAQLITQGGDLDVVRGERVS